MAQYQRAFQVTAWDEGSSSALQPDQYLAVGLWLVKTRDWTAQHAETLALALVLAVIVAMTTAAKLGDPESLDAVNDVLSTPMSFVALLIAILARLDTKRRQ